jgi:hypothetical protein
MIDPQGRIAQTNMPPGVFGQFLDWPTSDWLGTSFFSEGGGFYPVKNKDSTSTVLYTPINQTGTYTLLVHSTLFGGQSTTEPFTVLAKFSSIIGDDSAPKIFLSIPQFVNDSTVLQPEITDENQFSVRYYLDETEISFTNNILQSVKDGLHTLKIEAIDETGNTSTQIYTFIVDRTPPEILVKSPTNNAKISDKLVVDFTVKEDNPDSDRTTISVANQILIQNKTLAEIDTYNLTKGVHEIIISAQDKSGNTAQKIITFEIDGIPNITQNTMPKTSIDYNLVLLVIAGAIAIGVASFIAFAPKSRKLPKN